MFKQYKRSGDFVGMDMARKFIQMGYTRSRRYANHRSGRKYNAEGKVLPRDSDKVKARSASEFARYLEKIQSDAEYLALKADWKRRIG
jgi:hypothetical protein